VTTTLNKLSEVAAFLNCILGVPSFNLGLHIDLPSEVLCSPPQPLQENANVTPVIGP
jgi:hypothetical protein